MGGLRGQFQVSSVSNMPLLNCPDESIHPYFEKLYLKTRMRKTRRRRQALQENSAQLTLERRVCYLHARAAHCPHPSGLRVGRGPGRMRIPGPPVSQAEVVFEGRAVRNAHLRAGVGTVQDSAVGPAAPLPLRSAVVLKKYGAVELVEDDGVHGAGWQGCPARPQCLGARPPGAPQGSGSRR